MIQSNSRYNNKLYGSIIRNRPEYPKNKKGDKKDDKRVVGNTSSTN